MADHPTCSTCPFFDRYAATVTVGSCRALPPRVQAHPDPEVCTSLWPEVNADEDWCGQHPWFRLRKCRVCGCTDLDCSGCIERTGEPCSWREDLETDDGPICSACAEVLDG